MLRPIFVAIGVTVLVLGGVLTVHTGDRDKPAPTDDRKKDGDGDKNRQQLTGIQIATAKVSTGGSNAVPPCGAATEGQRFVVSQDGKEVCDNSTGLHWQQNPDSKRRSHADALAYCPKVRSGSRLPQVKELVSLLDYTKINPALPADHPFTNAQSANYWSAAVDVDPTTSNANAWRVLVNSGSVRSSPKDSPFFVWCVRGG